MLSPFHLFNTDQIPAHGLLCAWEVAFLSKKVSPFKKASMIHSLKTMYATYRLQLVKFLNYFFTKQFTN